MCEGTEPYAALKCMERGGGEGIVFVFGRLKRSGRVREYGKR